MTARLTLLLATATMIMALAGGLYWKGRQDEAARQRPKIEAALSQAKVSGLEAQGAQASARRVDTAVHRREAASAVVAQLMPKALKSEDANAPLEPSRAARLRDADVQLCDAAPDIGACAKIGNTR